MPSTSKKQHNFMEAVAHSPAFAKKAGVPQSVGKEFSNADKGKTFKRGGEMATKMDPKMMAMMMKKKSPMAPAAAAAPAAPMGMMKKGGSVKKMASGGLAAGHKSADGIAKKGKTQGMDAKMKRGGMARGC
jgi:hypothetical protein